MSHYRLMIRVDGTRRAVTTTTNLDRIGEAFPSLVHDLGGAYVVTGRPIVTRTSPRPFEYEWEVDAAFDSYRDAQRAARVMLRLASSHLTPAVGSCHAEEAVVRV